MKWANLKKVNEVISYLEAIDRNALEHLRSQFSDSRIFEADTIIQEDEQASYQKEVIACVTLCKTALESVLKKCNEYQPVLKQKLKTLGQIQSASQILILIHGTFLLTSVSKTCPVLLHVTGSFTVLGAVLTLVAQFKSGVMTYRAVGIIAFYDKLMDSKFEAEQQSLELELAFKAYDGKNPQRLMVAISNVNDRCLTAKKLLEKMTIISGSLQQKVYNR